MAVTSTEGRVVVFHTAALTPKTTRSTQGVNVMTLKPKYKVADARPLADTTIVNAARYRGPLPAHRGHAAPAGGPGRGADDVTGIK